MTTMPLRCPHHVHDCTNIEDIALMIRGRCLFFSLALKFGESALPMFSVFIRFGGRLQHDGQTRPGYSGLDSMPVAFIV